MLEAFKRSVLPFESEGISSNLSLVRYILQPYKTRKTLKSTVYFLYLVQTVTAECCKLSENLNVLRFACWELLVLTFACSRLEILMSQNSRVRGKVKM